MPALGHLLSEVQRQIHTTGDAEMAGCVNHLLTILWVSAHHGLRLRRTRGAMPSSLTEHAMLWGWVRDITADLGNPPAPGGPA